MSERRFEYTYSSVVCVLLIAFDYFSDGISGWSVLWSFVLGYYISNFGNDLVNERNKNRKK